MNVTPIRDTREELMALQEEYEICCRRGHQKKGTHIVVGETSWYTCIFCDTTFAFTERVVVIEKDTPSDRAMEAGIE